MAKADRLTIESGLVDGIGLMRRAGQAIAAVILERFPDMPGVAVLAGPGNNGGDGYVIAEELRRAGVDVTLWRAEAPRGRYRCRRRGDRMHGAAAPARRIRAASRAGLSSTRCSAPGSPARWTASTPRPSRKLEAAGARVVAVDLPSGVSGLSGEVLGIAPRAETTVTFFRKKPGHLLYPGRRYCGETVVADIGIRSDVLASIGGTCVENDPANWSRLFPSPAADTHKYARGHVGVFSGGPAATGAARLSAMAAARAGAGAVTLLSPANALAVNAAHLTSIILKKAESMDDVAEFLAARKPGALVFGPGLGTHAKVGRFALDLISAAAGLVGAFVFDADGLTVLAANRDEFFEQARSPGAPALVLTPHEGEFRRLFPDLASRAELSKLDRARQAAAMANAVVIYKGPDTVIAAPDGRAAINSERHAAACHRRLRRCAGRHLRRADGAAHAAFRGGLRGGVDACRGGQRLRAGADRRGPAACACPRDPRPCRRHMKGSAMKRVAAGLLALASCLGLLPAQAAEKPVLFVEQPLVLYELEDAGYDFGDLFGASGTRDLERLYREAPAYKAIVDTIAADLGQLREEIKSGGRTLHEFTGAETGRVMDMRWLSSPGARMRLVGVINRLDRRDFHDLRGEAGCGEMRLIFRLAYAFHKDGKGKTLSSKMPFNFNAVYDILPGADGRCADVAQRWTPADGQLADAQWLAARPARSPAPSLPPARIERASGALPVRARAAIRRAGGLSHAHLRARRRSGRRAAAGEHARRRAAFGGRSPQGRACRLCQRQCAGDRPGRLHDPGPLAGAQGDLLFDLRQCAPDQPSVHAAAVAGGFRRPRFFEEPAGALAGGAAGAARQRHLPGLPSVGRDRRLPLHRPRRQVHLAAQPHRGRHLAAFPRRAAAPRRLCRGRSDRARAEPVQAAVVRTACRLAG